MTTRRRFTTSPRRPTMAATRKKAPTPKMHIPATAMRSALERRIARTSASVSSTFPVTHSF